VLYRQSIRKCSVQWNVKSLFRIIKLKVGHVEAFQPTVKQFIFMYIRRKFCEIRNGERGRRKYQKQRGRNNTMFSLIINTLKLQVASVLRPNN
jgi:hypothetical protein